MITYPLPILEHLIDNIDVVIMMTQLIVYHWN